MTGEALREEVFACPVPVEERCCCVTLYRTLERTPGLLSMRYDTAEPRVEIEYDPGTFDPREGNRLLEDLRHSLRERRAVCRDREQNIFRRGCGYCVQQLKLSQRESHAPVLCDSADCTALVLLQADSVHFRGGVMTLEHPRRKKALEGSESRTHVIHLEQSGIAALARPGTDSGADRDTGGGLVASLIARTRQLPWEPIAVLVTLTAMITGALLERRLELLSPATLAAYATAYLSGGYFGLRAGLTSLRERRIDVDLLMILAAIGAAAIGSPFEGSLLLFLFSLSNVLQDYALDRTRSAIRALEKLRPESALVLSSLSDQEGRRLPVEEIELGAFVQVRPGDRIPLDGVVESGSSGVDQSSVTGESMPVDKNEGDDVLAGTINQNGMLIVRVRKTARESTIARIITLVEEARVNQAKTERFLDRFEQYYAMGVIGVTILASFLPVMLVGMGWEESIYKAITLMVAASPCALIISTPASILSSIGNGARRGILFKGGVHVEQAGIIKVVAFDKTGTLTEGRPRLSDVRPLGDVTEEEALGLAAALESRSEHVIAAAVVAAARERGITIPEVQDFRSESGIGVRGVVQGRTIRLGSPAILGEEDESAGAARAVVDELEGHARTAIVLRDLDTNRTLAVLAVMDRIRPEARQVIADLKEAGITRVVMLTGDNRRTAEAIGAEAGVDEVYPELLPEDKLKAIRRIESEYGPTAMVGDGVNDAPALAGARLGIAMGAAGTDVALETADVVLLSDELEKVPYLIALSRRTRRTLVTNLTVAMGLILMMVVAIYTIDLPLPLAVIGHEGGTVLVSLNGLRLLMFRHARRKS
ncbi:MAG: heavy metal translocating P-type ATPase [Spirochaetaceae bacterium]|nr:MAG: heavy metal translocating P-type ATPase [Spirochaetaceae bacterium]